jgi:hypothetical protein
LKNASPVEQVAGNAVPALAGFVVCAFDASQSPFIVRPPILVLCPYAHPIAAPNRIKTRRMPYSPLMIVALYTALAGLTFCPMAQSRTVIWLAALTHMFPISPLAMPLGHPGATVSPGVAPVRVNVRSGEQVPADIGAKVNETELFRYVGTAVVSIPIVVWPPDSTATMPVPASSVLLLIQLRQSIPVAPQLPPAAFHEYSGIESTGNPVTPTAATQELEQVTFIV